MKIDCINIVNKEYEILKEQIFKLKQKKIIPHLVILQNNNLESSKKYVDIKVQKAKELGINVSLINDFSNEEELIHYINKLNNDKSVHGYIVQLPLPKNINQNNIFKVIDLKKDVDGLSLLSTYNNYINNDGWYPKACTANGIMKILESVNYDLTSKNVVIINRSLIVGKPLALMMINKNATVTICHSKTENIKLFTQNADVVVIAIANKHFLTNDMVKDNVVVIDAGINVENNKVYGDVSPCVYKKAKYYTSVPNGVGKLTVLYIFKNLINLINESEGK